MTRLRPWLAALLLSLPVAPALAQPRPPAPVERTYPGVIGLEVDVSDVERRIWRVKETIPVAAPGRLTLVYPQWLPGNHAPSGQLDKLAGLTIRGGGRTLEWRRDPTDLYAFHVDVPAGMRSLELSFQFLSPFEAIQGGRIYVSPDVLNLQWQAALLYPKGYPTKGVTVAPTVVLPTGWTQAGALQPARDSAAGQSRVAFEPVTLETLVDSPLFAGRRYADYDLDPGPGTVRLHVFAATPERVRASEAQIEAHRELVRQSDKLFGVRRFERYDFLLALTDELWGGGIEHLRLSENITVPGYFTEWDKTAGARDLLPHEYVHSWNGKHTRPAGLEQRDLNTPVDARLLWVYEGLTDYWGTVLAARAGLTTVEQGRDALALIAAGYEHRPGRGWRSVEDTTADPAIAYRRPRGWSSWQRGTDYYTEGALVWLEADVLIRERSGGARSLDDFARAFFGRPEAGPMPQLYDEADVVRVLNGVEPYDWAGFLSDRFQRPDAPSPKAGLERGGYRLVYGDEPSAAWIAAEGSDGVNLTYSLGFTARKDGTVSSVLWDGQAFRERLAPGVRILSVNGLVYDDAKLRAAVKAKGPVELIVRQGESVRSVRLDASAGPRFPRLERTPATRAWLDEVLAKR